MRLSVSVRDKLRTCRLWYFRYRYRAWGVDGSTYLARGSSIHRSLRMGAYGYIGVGSEIPSGVTVGNYVMIASEVTITGNDHRFDIPGVAVIFSGRPEPKATVIEDDVWIGSQVIIMRGLTIERGAIVAAGSVVTRNVAPYSIVGGVPARFIRMRFNDQEIEIHDQYLASPASKGRFCDPLQ